MTDDNRKWNLKRAEQLRSALSGPEIDALRAREEADLSSLTLDELGVLFLEGRERIRAMEAKARAKGGGPNDPE